MEQKKKRDGLLAYHQRQEKLIRDMMEKYPGLNRKELASVLGYSYKGMLGATQRYGIFFANARHRLGKNAHAIKEALEDDPLQSYQTIGSALGISKQRVEQLVRKMNLVPLGKRYKRVHQRECRACGKTFRSFNQQITCRNCRSTRCKFCGRKISNSLSSEIKIFCNTGHYFRWQRELLSRRAIAKTKQAALREGQ